MTHEGDDGDGDGGEDNGDGGEGDGDGDCKPVEGELVEPHGAHEGDVGELVVEQLSLLLRGVHHPQSGQFLKDDSLK